MQPKLVQERLPSVHDPEDSDVWKNGEQSKAFVR